MSHMNRKISIGVKDRMIDIVNTLQDYTKYREVCRDQTSLSVSGLHFTHWKAAAPSNEVA